jgi:hypothetical protein
VFYRSSGFALPGQTTPPMPPDANNLAPVGGFVNVVKFIGRRGRVTSIFSYTVLVRVLKNSRLSSLTSFAPVKIP